MKGVELEKHMANKTEQLTARAQAQAVAKKVFDERNSGLAEGDKFKNFYLVPHGGGNAKAFSVRLTDKHGVVTSSEYLGVFVEPRY